MLFKIKTFVLKTAGAFRRLIPCRGNAIELAELIQLLYAASMSPIDMEALICLV
ncbi:hypothetical protein [Neobacillus sp. OS1-33]|uniref:hypothetical protein n=1 Tax=Neobacillus sp. OS1-33 TaxID=3070683 RepID=UPI0027E14B56|nr:hypothetical protein [Neobacillus sp. OS1-33]WML24240.1 hypothetical protein RCG22_15010 [Neobacillus sp. OS1-33]